MSQEKIERWNEVDGNLDNDEKTASVSGQHHGCVCDFAAAPYRRNNL